MGSREQPAKGANQEDAWCNQNTARQRCHPVQHRQRQGSRGCRRGQGLTNCQEGLHFYSEGTIPGL